MNPVGIVGRLALFWNGGTQILMNKVTSDFLDVIYENIERRQQCRMTFVHDPTTFQDQLASFEWFNSLNSQAQLLWSCLGDFNEIHYH